MLASVDYLLVEHRREDASGCIVPDPPRLLGSSVTLRPRSKLAVSFAKPTTDGFHVPRTR